MLRLALHWQILIAMIAGAVIGVTLNVTAGTYRMERSVRVEPGRLQPRGFGSPIEVPPGRFWSLDSPDRVQMQFDERVPGTETYRTRRAFVAGPEIRPADWLELPPQAEEGDVPIVAVTTLDQLMQADSVLFGLFYTDGRSTARWVGDAAKLLGDLFLRMLKMVSIPLIITSLVTGVTSLGQAGRLGRMFGRTLLYYVITSFLAICTGLLMVNLIEPGGADVTPAAAQDEDAKEIDTEAEEALKAQRRREGKSLGSVLFEQLENLIPPNPIEAVAEGNFLSIIAFSLAFAIFTIVVGGSSAERISDFFQAAFDVMMAMTMAIIHLAPIGVFFLMLYVTATQGIGIFGVLGWYMFTVVCALAVHAIITLPLILKLVAKRNPREFAEAMSPALLTAFSSASSNGTLPLTMSSVEKRAGVSNRVSSFVLPLGATVNMDGTALYEVVAVLFIAQLTPGIDLTLPQQIIVAFTALLASIGAAGIPHAGLVMMIIILQAVGLPTETQGLIIAVDRVLDMCRTSVNVWSDSCGCAVIARFEAGGSETQPVPIPEEGELNL